MKLGNLEDIPKNMYFWKIITLYKDTSDGCQILYFFVQMFI